MSKVSSLNMRHFVKKPVFACLIAFATLGLGACQTETLNRGYILDEKALAQIKVGSSAEQVVLVLGTPSTTSTVGSKTYYYISQRTEQQFQFMQPSLVDQKVLAIYLNQGNKVERIANYGMQDGVVFDFISRKTETGGAEQAFLLNLFRSVGNIFPG